MPDTPTGETANAGDSKTEVQPVATPAVNATVPADVEQLKKEAQQATMRANQLQNQLDEAKKAKEAAEAKKLEENNEYKSLWEQSEAKRKETEQQMEDQQRNQAIEQGTQEIFSQFSTDVVELAKETGLSLTDTSDEAKVAFKEKLDKIAARVVTSQPVNASNPNTNVPTADRATLLQRAGNGDQQAKNDLIASLPAVQEMRRMSGFSQNQ